jgi:hypothetical protein
MHFFCKHIHIIHRNTQTQYKQACSCTQMFVRESNPQSVMYKNGSYGHCLFNQGIYHTNTHTTTIRAGLQLTLPFELGNMSKPDLFVAGNLYRTVIAILW